MNNGVNLYFLMFPPNTSAVQLSMWLTVVFA